MARHQLDQAAIRRLLTSPRGGVARDFQRRGRRVLDAARREVGVTSGRTRRSLHVREVGSPWRPGIEVGSPLPSVRHHLRGHGVIRPRRAKALRFKPKGGTRYVYAKRVRAVAGNPFLQRALRAARG